MFSVLRRKGERILVFTSERCPPVAIEIQEVKGGQVRVGIATGIGQVAFPEEAIEGMLNEEQNIPDPISNWIEDEKPIPSGPIDLAELAQAMPWDEGEV